VGEPDAPGVPKMEISKYGEVRRIGRQDDAHAPWRNEQDLIDEYRLMVFPVALGSGKRLCPERNEQLRLKLVESKPFASGVVVLTYQPIRV